MKEKKDTILAWHFTDGMKLRDGQPLIVGKTYIHTGPLVLCYKGLHASVRAIDALWCAPGNTVSRVECWGRMEVSDDKLVCSYRKVISTKDVTNELREFARWCALQVIHLWDAPDIVKQYLETGDESIRKDANSAVNSTIWSAWSATRSTRSTWSAADSAAHSAALSARSAAKASVKNPQNDKLEELLK